MKKISFLLTTITVLFIGQSRALAHYRSASLTVNIHCANCDKGQIIVNLFTKEGQTFKKPAMQRTLKIGTDNSVTFIGLPYGENSVLAFYDKNNNNGLDHNLGIPAEPLGRGNGWRFSLFSAEPAFEKTKFIFSENNQTITIEIN